MALLEQGYFNDLPPYDPNEEPTCNRLLAAVLKHRDAKRQQRPNP